MRTEQYLPTSNNVIHEYFKNNIDRIQAADLGKRLREDSAAELKGYGFDSSFRYVCDCCTKSMVEPQGYLLRTFEILLSEKYLKRYFELNGLTTTKEDLELRHLHFMHLAGYTSPWIICEDCILLFDVDLKAAKIFAE